MERGPKAKPPQLSSTYSTSHGDFHLPVTSRVIDISRCSQHQRERQRERQREKEERGREKKRSARFQRPASCRRGGEVGFSPNASPGAYLRRPPGWDRD